MPGYKYAEIATVECKGNEEFWQTTSGIEPFRQRCAKGEYSSSLWELNSGIIPADKAIWHVGDVVGEIDVFAEIGLASGENDPAFYIACIDESLSYDTNCNNNNYTSYQSALNNDEYKALKNIILTLHNT
jgi:hypothetical protein